MLTIRLMRFGRKRQPFFRLVVVPKRGKPDRSKYVEMLGWINPLKHERAINAERVKYWISKGAQPSDTALNLFVQEKILSEPKRKKGAGAGVVKPVAENAEVKESASSSAESEVELGADKSEEVATESAAAPLENNHEHKSEGEQTEQPDSGEIEEEKQEEASNENSENADSVEGEVVAVDNKSEA